METIEKYFRPVHREFMRLSRWCSKMLLDWEKNNRPLNEKERTFLDNLSKTEQNILRWAQEDMDREKREADKKEKHFRRVNEPCPKCKKTNQARVIGTAKNTLGHTIRKLNCSRCHKVYHDYMPIDEEEQMTWLDNFFHQLTKERDGIKSHLETLGMGPEELQEQKDNLEKIRASLLKSKELGRKAEEAYKASDKAIESINETLLKIQVDTINWNNNIGMA